MPMTMLILDELMCFAMHRLGESNWKDLTVEVGISAITLSQFLLVRRVLEEFEDFGLLSEVRKLYFRHAFTFIDKTCRS